MKLIHLSDLHIGKRVHEVAMIEDQEYILAQILTIIDSEKADAVLIAGDVYDKNVPSAEAVTLFDDFLCRLAARKVPVLVISGNHDSPERLAFGGRLFETHSIHISRVYDGTVKPVVLSDAHGEVYFWLLPFVKPAHVKRYYLEDAIESYTDALGVVIGSMNINASARNVLLTHQFVTGASTCESEEISVGGSDNVDVSVFADFDYVALGHIHGPQNIGSDRVRYCGTPLKYSFSEAKHHKSVTVVELGEKGALMLEQVPLKPLHDMREIRGKFADLEDKAYYSRMSEEERCDYLHMILTDEEDVIDAVGRLRKIYPNILKLTYDNTRTRAEQIVNMAKDVKSKSPLILFEELYEQVNNRTMSDEQRTFVKELLDGIKEGTV